MRALLHLLTRPNDPFALGIAALQSEDVETKIETFDLTVENLDYHLLLQKIFEADSVQVW